MSKLSLFFLSLIGAVPAGFLATLLALNFLSRADQMETMMQVVSGLTLAISALVTVLPFGILIFGPVAEKPEPAVAPVEATSEAEVAVVEEQESEVLLTGKGTGEFNISDGEVARDSQVFATEADFKLPDDDDIAFATDAEMEEVDFAGEFGDEEENA